ncbi:unnamed protein product [Closterium sp. NIES-64]|nr:unnamed protein product [Closterium sp. NIES-64]
MRLPPIFFGRLRSATLRISSTSGLVVSLPETSPTLLWTGKVGDALVFRVWGDRAFVCDTTVEKLSARAIPCVFLGFVPDVPWLAVLRPRLAPYLCVDPPVPAPVEVTGDSGPAGGGPAWGTVSGGAELGGAEPEHEEPGGAEPGGVRSLGVLCLGVESPTVPEFAAVRSPWSSRLRPRVPLTSQQLHGWYGRRQGRASELGALLLEVLLLTSLEPGVVLVLRLLVLELLEVLRALQVVLQELELQVVLEVLEVQVELVELLVVLLELVLALGVLVMFLLVLGVLSGRGRTSFRSLSRFLVSRLLLVLPPP